MLALLDNDVVLDFLLEREPFFKEAEQIFTFFDKQKFTAYIAAITPLNAFYVLRKAVGRENALSAIDELLKICEVCFVDKLVLQSVFSLSISDYEDAVQCASAIVEHVDVIVTRNLSDFQNSPMPVQTPTEFIEVMARLP